MNRFSRFLACALALSLVLASAPYEAAAQVVTGRIAPVGSIGSSAAAINAGGVSNAALPMPSLTAGLVPTIAPSAALVPTFAPAATLAAGVKASASIAPTAAITAAPAVAAAAATPAAPLQALHTGAAAIAAAAAKHDDSGAPHEALKTFFEGSVARPAALEVSGLSAPSDSPRLDAPDAQPAKGPRWVKGFRDDGDKPATSLKRTLSVGFLAAVVPIALTMGAVIVAQLLGYELHPNYKGPAGTDTTNLVQALAIWVGAAVMAPISEEAIFRGGLQGRLAKLSKKLHLGAFVVPALITSVVFVALHETSDPLLFSTRLVHAMILSYVYQKEGILASMAAHGFFNGLLALSIVTAALGMPWLSLATVPLALWGVWKARKILKSQKAAIASGALAPKPMGAITAFAFAALLMAGYFFIMPNIFWPLGAAALVWAGMQKLKNS